MDATGKWHMVWGAMLGLTSFFVSGCLPFDRPLVSVHDLDLKPPLETLRTIAFMESISDSIPTHFIESQNLMAAFIWSESGDTIYQQAQVANREWPLRLNIPLVSTPPHDALMNVSENGAGRFGMALLVLFEDANGNGRYDAKVPEVGESPLPNEDQIWGMAAGTRILYISNESALEWVRTHQPKDIVLTVLEPSRLQVGLNLMNAVNVRDTVFRQYRVLYPGGGFGLEDNPPDSGEYEILNYPKKICDGFVREDWNQEVRLSMGPHFNPLTHLIIVPSAM
jgi:hypothetical protein